MHCASCGHDNRADASFCSACGTKLSLVCSSCGRELPTGARFCDACGQRVEAPGAHPPDRDPRSYTPNHLAAKILTARSALQGERKQVTVLFADVAGSTALAERLDPEDVHGIMDGCFRILLEEVHRYEGTVNQFTGDGIMALFGAPIAHEDAPERAVRAALGMQRSLKHYGAKLSQRGIDFRMRIGINTGPVVVGRIGDDLRMDYTAVGDTTNLAARLQTAAEPGTVLISDHTAKLVAGRLVMRPVGPLELKGKSQPVTAHEVVRILPRAPLVAPSERGLTPFVGRDAELATLEAAFARARGGHGQVMFVVGEAGIGKSRIIHEFKQRISNDAPRWLHGRCVSFGKGIPLLPVIDLLKGAFGIEEADDEGTIIDKIHRGLVAQGTDGHGGEPYLRALLAVDPGDPALATIDAGARRFATFDAIKRLLLTTAALQPLVVLIEDLHWLDPASEEFLTYIVDAVAVSRILLICVYRPGYRPVLSDRSYFNRLTLHVLSPEETSSMASAMLEAQEVPGEIRALIASKAEGNPFFIEEVTKSLMEMGALRRLPDGTVLAKPVSEIVIPNTIQDVIMARIDRLGDEPKRAIQIASVIGREFAIRLLQRASELGENVNLFVGELRALELIYEKLGVPELAYMFKHALTHDVAYQSLLMQHRKELHRTIGRTIEELYADRLAEYYETLAHHFERGEDWPVAFEYLVKAGDKAHTSFANAEAIHFYDRALAISAQLPIDSTRRRAIYESKARAHICISEFPQAIEAYGQALQLAPAARDRAAINAGLAEALLWAHEFDAALSAAGDAAAIARPAGDLGVTCQATFTTGFVYMVRGALDRAVECLTEAAQIAETTGQRTLGVMVGVYGAVRANWAGQYGSAVEQLQRLLPELKNANELLSLAEATSHLGITLAGAGLYDRAFPLLAEGVALSESIGEKVWRARMWNTRGWILSDLGALDAAEEDNQRCIDLAQQLGPLKIFSELVGNAEANLADIALARGELARTAAHLEHVSTILGDPRNEWMTWRYGMHFRLTAADLALARGALAQAHQYINDALATAQRTASRRYLVRAWRLLAACHIADGNLAQADQLLAQTVPEARALGNPPQLWHALLEHARLLHTLGRRDEAAVLAREALALGNAIAATLPDDLRSAFRLSAVFSGPQELGA